MAIDHEKVKRVADQVKRRQEVNEREQLFASKVIPKQVKAVADREKLMVRYAAEREDKMDREEMRRSM